MENISFSDWQKLDLRVGKILSAKEIEGANKLYKLEIDLGKELRKRTLVAGLKGHYKKEELENKQCIVFTNLESRKIRGVKSQGMLLAAVSESKDGKGETVGFLQPDKEIEEGSKIM